MAELNFGLLTPPGSQSISNAFVTGMDQARAAQVQENQNALSQYTLSKAKREDELANQLLGDLRGATTDEQIYRAYQRAGKGKEASELQNAALTRRKLAEEIAAYPGARAHTAAQTGKLQDEARSKAIGEVAGFPDVESALAAIDARLANKTIGQATADQLRQGLTPENFPKWKHDTLMRLLTPVEQLKQSVVTTKDTDMGGFIERQAYNAQGGAVGAPIILPKTPTPGSVPGIAQAATAAAIARDQGVDVPGAAPAQPGAPSAREIREARAKGYAFKPDGTMSSIPGGPADPAVQATQTTEKLSARELQKREAAYPQATTSVKGFDAKAKSFIKDLVALRDDPGLEQITGPIYGRTGSVSRAGSRAQALYDKIVAKGGFQALQDLRDASKTGGALGNTSNFEVKTLQASVAALDQRQNMTDVKAALNQLIDEVEGSNARVRGSYDATYAYKTSAGSTAPLPAPTAPVDISSAAAAELARRKQNSR